MTVIIILASVIITSIVWYKYHNDKIQQYSKEKVALANELNNLKSNIDYKINHEAFEKTQHLNDKILTLKEDLVKTEKDSYFKGRTEAIEEFKNDFYVEVLPYKRNFKEKKDSIIAFGVTEKVEVGYQYQLFIKGVPSLNPAVIILETHELKHFKLNEEAIQLLVNASIGDKSQIAGGVIKVAKKLLLKSD